MDVVKHVAEIFFLCLGVGTAIKPDLTDIQATGLGLPKLIEGVALGCLAITGLIYLSEGNFNTKVLIFTLFFLRMLLSFILSKDIFFKFFPSLVRIVLATLLILLAGSHLEERLFLILTMGFLGMINHSMLLGHYYLVVPNLSEKYLLKAFSFFLVFFMLKALHSIFFFSWELFESDRFFFWIVGSMRLLWGYLLMGVLSIFTWRLIRMRSIQSATGILYVMVFFALIGELIALYTYYSKGIFL